MFTLPTRGVGDTCEGHVNTKHKPAANGRSTLIIEVNIDSAISQALSDTQELLCSWTDINLITGDGVSEQLKDYTVTVVL